MNGLLFRLEHLLLARRAVPILLLIFLLPRIGVLFFHVAPTSDAGWYFNQAMGLARGVGYAEGGVPTAYWPPGYPLALSLIFKIFSPSLLAAQLFNIACAVASAWLVLDLGRRAFSSEVTGRAALLLLAIYPNSIGYIPLLFTETFYTALLLGGCWIIVVCRGLKRLFLAGVLFGIATLVKAQSLVVIPMIFLVSVLREQAESRNYKKMVMEIALTIVFAAFIVFPWSYRNHQVFGEWIAVSTNGGMTLLTGNNPSARGDYTPDDPLVTSIPRTVATQVEVDREAKRRAINWITSNPEKFIGLIPLKIFRLWAPDGESEWFWQRGFKAYDRYEFWFRVVRVVNQVYYVALIVGFLIAGYLLFSGWLKAPKSKIDWWALPYFVALFPTAIAVVFSGQSRFHFPIMPFIMMVNGWLIFAENSPLRSRMIHSNNLVGHAKFKSARNADEKHRP